MTTPTIIPHKATPPKLPPTLLRRRLTAAVLLLVSAVAYGAQLLPPAALTDISGTPASYTARVARRQIARSYRRQTVLASRRRDQRAARVAKLDTDLKRAKRPVRRYRETLVARNTPPRRPNTPAPPRPAPAPRPAPVLVEEVPFQNVAFRFQNPRGGAVANLPVVARVRRQDGTVSAIENLTTDAQGVVRLAKVGPLPVTLEVEPAGAGAAAETEPEWRLQNVGEAGVLLAQAQGRRVARVDRPAPYQVAGVGRLAFAGQKPGEKVVRREVTYEAPERQTVVVERTVVPLTVAAPQGSVVSTEAIPGRTFPVGEGGSVILKLPVGALGDGPVPLRVARDLPAGEAESLVTAYPTDPYEENAARAPAPGLVRLDRFRLAEKVGVLSRREQIAAALGDLSSKRRPKGLEGTVTKAPDGAEFWEYPKAGLRLKMRPTGEKDAALVERVRVLSPGGGDIGGLSVGDDAAGLKEALGTAAGVTPGEEGRGEVHNYLDGGLRVSIENGRIGWIEFARPTELLQSGTTAFVPRTAARLFVEEFVGDERTGLPDAAAFESYLRRVGSVRLVKDRDDADLVLSARIAEFKEDRGEIVFQSLPFRYAATVTAEYTLTDAVSGKPFAEAKRVSKKSSVDYGAEAAGTVLLAAILAAKGGDIGKVVAVAVGAAGVVELQRIIKRAAGRCPGLATRAAFDEIVRDLSRAADFSARVTSIDYAKNRLTLNVGTAQGVAVPTPEKPFEFELRLGDEGALPSKDSGLNAEYLVARVVEASEDRSVCELRRVKRRVREAKETNEDAPAADEIKRLPDPATGVLSARVTVRFPDMPVLGDPGEAAPAPEEPKEKKGGRLFGVPIP